MKKMNKFAVAIAALAALTAGRASAGMITDGYDLLETTTPTTFLGQNFQGVPLGTYDFGGTIGVKNVGMTDTIVHRTATDANTLVPATIPVQMLSLQLQSTTPFDPGAGTDFYYVTLQSNRSGGEGGPGPATVGNLSNVIESNPPFGGTNDSFFDVFFDFRKGALNGPIVFSDELQLTATNNPWTHLPPPGTLLIDGVNHNLNGTDGSTDFFTAGTESHPSGAQHSFMPTAVPEPSVTGVFALALAVLALFRAKTRFLRQ